MHLFLCGNHQKQTYRYNVHDNFIIIKFGKLMFNTYAMSGHVIKELTGSSNLQSTVVLLLILTKCSLTRIINEAIVGHWSINRYMYLPVWLVLCA